MKIRPEDALEYHSSSPAGKLSVIPTKPCRTQRDLSLAYTPGVAVPCLEIERDPSLAYNYTAKGNLVGVVSNGTAVLGLGNASRFSAPVWYIVWGTTKNGYAALVNATTGAIEK